MQKGNISIKLQRLAQANTYHINTDIYPYIQGKRVVVL